MEAPETTEMIPEIFQPPRTTAPNSRAHHIDGHGRKELVGKALLVIQSAIEVQRSIVSDVS